MFLRRSMLQNESNHSKSNEKYEIGDFIKLKDRRKFIIDRYDPLEVNIYEITFLSEDFIKIKDCIEVIPFNEIEPIPINGQDDYFIYYDPIVMASVLRPGEIPPIHRTNYDYFMNRFQNCKFENTQYLDVFKGDEFKYVHQIQHYLRKYNDNGLKIKHY